MTPTFTRRRLILAGGTALLATGAAAAAWLARPLPDDLDLALDRVTDGGLYRACMEPGLTPLALGTMHHWTLGLREADGQPVDGAMIRVDGGMPRHGHGLPTAPRVTAATAGGDYRIDGMKFNMPGWWTVELAIDGPAGADAVTFNLVL